MDLWSYQGNLRGGGKSVAAAILGSSPPSKRELPFTRGLNHTLILVRGKSHGKDYVRRLRRMIAPNSKVK